MITQERIANNNNINPMLMSFGNKDIFFNYFDGNYQEGVVNLPLLVFGNIPENISAEKREEIITGKIFSPVHVVFESSTIESVDIVIKALEEYKAILKEHLELTKTEK